jgi:hypothetical protein
LRRFSVEAAKRPKGGPAKITLTADQRAALAKELSFPIEAIPHEFPVMGLTVQDGARMGIPKEMSGKFMPGGIMIS